MDIECAKTKGSGEEGAFSAAEQVVAIRLKGL